MRPDDIEHALSSARRARAEGHIDEALSILREAAAAAEALDEEHPLRQVTSWRLAKAEYDHGEPRAMLEALRGVLDDEDPFAHYPKGLEAVEPLARRFWDRVGYGEPLVARLWTAFSEAWRRRGEPYLAAAGEVHLLWELACGGQLDELHRRLDRLALQVPETFGDGPHRHARAPDTPSSVFWVQMDAARTGLRAATWAGDERLGRLAAELYEDAAEEAMLVRERDPWFLEALVHAGRRFGWRETRGYEAPYTALLARWPGARPEVHVPLGRGVLGTGAEAVRALLDAADAAQRLEAGPEWTAAALVEATRAAAAADLPGDPRWRARVERIIEEHGVGVFRDALSAS